MCVLWASPNENDYCFFAARCCARFNSRASWRVTKAEIKILASYKIKIGIDTMTCVEISGGVITAETTKTMINAYFLYFLKNCGVTKPILVKK